MTVTPTRADIDEKQAGRRGRVVVASSRERRACVPGLPFLLLLGLLALCAPASSAQTLYVDAQFGATLTSNVVYATKLAGDPAAPMDLRLELYEPSGAGVPSARPVIIAMHGGGFTGGTRFNPRMLGLCDRMARRGWTCVSIEYRLQGDQPVVGPDFLTLEAAIAISGDPRATAIAAATEDAVAAMQWVVDNAGALDVDPQYLGLAGYSAGGVLTEMVSYMINGGGGVTLPVQPRVNLNLSGAFDPMVTIVEALEPPSIIIHGDADTTVDPAGATYLHGALQNLGIPSELYLLSGIGHTNYDIFTDEVAPGETYFDRAVVFMAAHAAPPVAPPVPALGVLGLGALAAALCLAGIAKRRPIT